MLKPIVIAAGGTGGHMFPAEALADALMRRGDRVVLMTDARSGATQSAVFAACERHVVEGAGLAGRGPARVTSGVVQLARGTRAARQILTGLDAAAVVGFGGYPSVPPVLATLGLRHRPVVILHDQNAILGGANRLLARFADHLALSFIKTAAVPRRIKTTLTGNPVRPAIAALVASPYTAPAHKINLLVLGGSLGARIFAGLIPAALTLLPSTLRGRINLTMQCPQTEIAAAWAELSAANITNELAPFFADVASRIEASHLVIARAGGSTVAELTVIGRPAIFIPLAINPDQRHNADAIARQGGAIRLDQASITPAILARAIETLLAEPGRLAAMAQAAASCGIADATARLADLVQTRVAECVS
ncbi:MAG: UDP-N-acetylglucosamine--N-acetylmuramyl-(pentapeptide) pyrophosphoryl-undecaprenol N-acetylglucosamine transferase [Acidiphilium sp.]|nr:UDP-N-acetylglucosamine--N-acetylmuramyl-(pentapeptide) pyrophosphoryl-undecaprenol N-acetylglucosamine transferase [Acidiphilium sp.]MDD4934274.1 UDP-N-acetylglucosamine--N-acetylmuramyl-(pentapeptide) pyrophosphoryl-undecaprenol N-acetylglucosamine transferase [Acidiphilium sp.]